MHKIAVLIYSALEGSGNSAVYRALMFAQELQRAGDDAVVVFDGGGSATAAALADPTHRMHTLFESVRSQVRGVCRHCAKSYGVLDAVQAAGLELLGDDRGHASLRALLQEGRQIVTF
jgi:hypothetical protein